MTRVCFIILTLLLQNWNILTMSRLEPADPSWYPRSVEIGKVGFVVYEEYRRGDPPDPICSPNDYYCTTPHGLCSDDRDKYQLVLVNDPITEFGGHKWFCGIQIEGVSFNDVGIYKICKLIGGAQTKHGCMEDQGLHINFAAWERDGHGRICQTTYNETSKELVNNCSSLTTSPQTTTITTTLTTTGIEEPQPPTDSAFMKVTTKPTTDFTSESHSGTSKELWIASVLAGTPVTVILAVVLTLTRVIKRRRSSSAEVIHTYVDMRNIPTRVTDGPNASGLPSASLSLSGTSSDLPQTTRVMPTPAVVTDTDVDAYGYTLPRSESVRTSASASMVDRRRIDYDIDENGYKIARKCEENDYAELI